LPRRVVLAGYDQLMCFLKTEDLDSRNWKKTDPFGVFILLLHLSMSKPNQVYLLSLESTINHVYIEKITCDLDLNYTILQLAP
jgi:hypothetical protein